MKPFDIRCMNCRFFDREWYKESIGYRTNEEPESGICRRYPPVVVNAETDYSWSMFEFPIVDYSEWCGEFSAVSETESIARIEQQEQEQEDFDRKQADCL